jgi:hypothetical protein
MGNSKLDAMGWKSENGVMAMSFPIWDMQGVAALRGCALASIFIDTET